MPLSDEFVHRDRIAKHGDKGKPGYELLHPGKYAGPTYRTPKQTATMERIGGLLQSGKVDEANALVERTQSLTPTQRKMVGAEIKRAKLRAKPKKPKVREIKGMQPATTTVQADAPPMQTATPVDLRPDDNFFPQESSEDDPGAWAARFDTWTGQIQRAQTTDDLTAIEEDIDAMAGPGSPMYDELQDLINAKHREHFERDRRSVEKWLAKRGIIRKHGNKGAPGYELLHPNSMLRGKRSEKQTKRLERLGSMLQSRDADGAQALLDRTLNLSDDDRKIVQTQIDAARGGKDGGKSQEAPEHKGQAALDAPAQPKATPDKAQSAPKAEKAPEPEPEEDEEEEWEPFDVTAMSPEEQQEYLEDVEANLLASDSEDDIDNFLDSIRDDLLPPKIHRQIQGSAKAMRMMLKDRGGVNSLPQNGETTYDRAKAVISKVLTTFAKQDRNVLFSAKKVQRKDTVRLMEREERDPDTTPAGKHLSSGGSVDDAPYDGLWAYIEANDGDRFEVTELGGTNVSDVYTVLDNETGTQHFFKRPLNGSETWDEAEGEMRDLKITGDGMNEIVAAELGNAAFPGTFLDAEFAEDPNGVPTPMLRFKHLDEVARDAKNVAFSHDKGDFYQFDPATDRVSLGTDATPLADRKQAVMIHVYDYLINNGDRHSGNIASMETEQGRVLIPIDNGGSFHALVQQVADNEETMDQSLMEPETVPYDVFQTQWGFNFGAGAKGRFMRAEAAAAYDGDVDALRADAQEVIEKFQKVNAKEILKRLRAKYPTMDEYERTHLEAAITVWENRLKMISADDVAKVLS